MIKAAMKGRKATAKGLRTAERWLNYVGIPVPPRVLTEQKALIEDNARDLPNAISEILKSGQVPTVAQVTSLARLCSL